MIDLFFIISFVINFIIGLNISQNVVSYSFHKIAQNNVYSIIFIFDLLLLIPSNSIRFLFFNQEFIDTSRLQVPYLYDINLITRLVAFIYVLDWIKLTYIYKGKNKYLEKSLLNADKNEIKLYLQKIISYIYVIAFFFILAHICTCIFLYIGFETRQIYGKNWIDYDNSNDKNLFELYINGLYFIFLTILTVEYGDIVPQNLPERIFSILLMLIGCFLYSYLIILGTVIFGEKDSKSQIINERKIILSNMSRDYNINSSLFNKINKSILTKNYLNWNNSLTNFLDSLPNLIKNEMSLKMYNQTIESFDFFKSKVDSFILFSVPLLKSFTYDKGDIIWSVGDKIDEMIFVQKGKLSLNLGKEYMNMHLLTIDENKNFGEVNMFENDSVSRYNLQAKCNFTKLYVLSKNNFLAIRNEFISIMEEELSKSLILYRNIEKKRIIASKYYLQNLTFEGFKTYLSQFKNIKNKEDYDITFSEYTSSDSSKEESKSKDCIRENHSNSKSKDSINDAILNDLFSKSYQTMIKSNNYSIINDKSLASYSDIEEMKDEEYLDNAYEDKYFLNTLTTEANNKRKKTLIKNQKTSTNNISEANIVPKSPQKGLTIQSSLFKRIKTMNVKAKSKNIKETLNNSHILPSFKKETFQFNPKSLKDIISNYSIKKDERARLIQFKLYKNDEVLESSEVNKNRFNKSLYKTNKNYYEDYSSIRKYIFNNNNQNSGILCKKPTVYLKPSVNQLNEFNKLKENIRVLNIIEKIFKKAPTAINTKDDLFAPKQKVELQKIPTEYKSLYRLTVNNNNSFTNQKTVASNKQFNTKKSNPNPISTIQKSELIITSDNLDQQSENNEFISNQPYFQSTNMKRKSVYQMKLNSNIDKMLSMNKDKKVEELLQNFILENKKELSITKRKKTEVFKVTQRKSFYLRKSPEKSKRSQMFSD